MSSFEDLCLYYRGLPLPRKGYSEDLKFFEEFNFKDDDILVVTYPKSGTTWMQEILTMVLNGGDPTPFQTIPSWERVPWLEIKHMAKHVDKLTSPRSLCTHFPYNLMPSSFHTSKAKACPRPAVETEIPVFTLEVYPTGEYLKCKVPWGPRGLDKVIYVLRNPKDILVSSYYFHQMGTFLEDPASLDEFMDRFLKGRVIFGKWTDHVKSWKCAELGDRILFITYEEMIQDLPASVRHVANFLGRNLSEEVIQTITEYCSFKIMKDNKMSNYTLFPKETMDTDKSSFMRKGIAGDWKNHFNSEQQARFASAIHKELEGESFSLPWSLD